MDARTAKKLEEKFKDSPEILGFLMACSDSHSEVLENQKRIAAKRDTFDKTPLKPPGSVETIYGPMFSEKTTSLIEIVERSIKKGLKARYFTHSKDSRHGDTETTVITHNHKEIENVIKIPNLLYFSDVEEGKELFEQLDVIALDEAHFFGGVRSFALKCIREGKRLVVAALNGDFQGLPFKTPETTIVPNETVYDLGSIVTKTVQLDSVCYSCRLRATMTKKLGGNKAEIEEIGGSNLYQPACVGCFNEYGLEKSLRSPLETVK